MAKSIIPVHVTARANAPRVSTILRLPSNGIFFRLFIHALWVFRCCTRNTTNATEQMVWTYAQMAQTWWFVPWPARWRQKPVMAVRKPKMYSVMSILKIFFIVVWIGWVGNIGSRMRIYLHACHHSMIIHPSAGNGALKMEQNLTFWTFKIEMKG